MTWGDIVLLIGSAAMFSAPLVARFARRRGADEGVPAIVESPIVEPSTLAEDTIYRIDHELALEELARMTPEERAGIDLWVRQMHYDCYHARAPFGIFSCCTYPTRPTS